MQQFQRPQLQGLLHLPIGTQLPVGEHPDDVLPIRLLLDVVGKLVHCDDRGGLDWALRAHPQDGLGGNQGAPERYAEERQDQERYGATRCPHWLLLHRVSEIAVRADAGQVADGRDARRECCNRGSREVRRTAGWRTPRPGYASADRPGHRVAGRHGPRAGNALRAIAYAGILANRGAGGGRRRESPLARSSKEILAYSAFPLVPLGSGEERESGGTRTSAYGGVKRNGRN